MHPDLDKTLRSLDRLRRFVFTAILYVAFGAGALVVATGIVLPVVIFSSSRDRRVVRVRRANRLAFSSFTRAGIWLGVFDVTFSGADKLDQPGQLIIANHPSLLDVVFLLGRVPNANCVVKKKLLRNPFLAIQVYFADYILNDDGEEMLERCRASVIKGHSVIIFPEGTRTSRNNGYRFQRGAAYLMLMTGGPVRPVYISCQPIALGKKDAWYSIPEHKITYNMTVMEALNLDNLRNLEPMKPPLKSRRLTRHLVEWYRAMDERGPHDAPSDIDFSTKINQL